MPESASFSMRKKPNYRRRRTVSILVLLVVVVVVVALLSRGGGIGGNNEKPTPTVAFVVQGRAYAQKKAPDAATEKANEDAVAKMFNDYYQTAFVDPKKWGDGTFPDLQELFVKSAKTTFTKDIDALTIGKTRTELKRVDPTATNLTITIYYDAKNKPTLAVATASFTARGTLKQTGPALTIRQKATYYLEKSGEGWIITSYDAQQNQDTPTASPSPSAS
jgi:hypothetical protein